MRDLVNDQRGTKDLVGNLTSSFENVLRILTKRAKMTVNELVQLEIEIDLDSVETITTCTDNLFDQNCQF